MDNKTPQSNSPESNVPQGYVAIKVLAQQSGYAVNHIAWLARSKRVDAIQRGNKGQWLVQESSLKKYQALVASEVVPKGHLPLKTLAKKHGYAKNYLATLAKTGKIEAFRDQKGSWYANEKSTEQYVLKAAIQREQRFSEHTVPANQNLLSSPKPQSNALPILSPTPSEEQNRGSSIPSQDGIGTVLFNEGSSNADSGIPFWPSSGEAVATKPRISGGLPKLNAALALLALAGGIVVFTFHPLRPDFSSISFEPLKFLNTIGDGISELFDWHNDFGPSPTIVAQRKETSVPTLPTPSPSETSTGSSIPQTPTSVGGGIGTTIINRYITVTQSITAEQLETLRQQLSGETLLNLSGINLQFVTTNGASTANAITVGGLDVTGTSQRHRLLQRRRLGQDRQLRPHRHWGTGRLQKRYHRRYPKSFRWPFPGLYK